MTHESAPSGIAVARPIEQLTESLTRNADENRTRTIRGILVPGGRIEKA